MASDFRHQDGVFLLWDQHGLRLHIFGREIWHGSANQTKGYPCLVELRPKGSDDRVVLFALTRYPSGELISTSLPLPEWTRDESFEISLIVRKSYGDLEPYVYGNEQWSITEKLTFSPDVPPSIMDVSEPASSDHPGGRAVTSQIPIWYRRGIVLHNRNSRHDMLDGRSFVVFDCLSRQSAPQAASAGVHLSNGPGDLGKDDSSLRFVLYQPGERNDDGLVLYPASPFFVQPWFDSSRSQQADDGTQALVAFGPKDLLVQSAYRIVSMSMRAFIERRENAYQSAGVSGLASQTGRLSDVEVLEKIEQAPVVRTVKVSTERAQGGNYTLVAQLPQTEFGHLVSVQPISPEYLITPAPDGVRSPMAGGNGWLQYLRWGNEWYQIFASSGSDGLPEFKLEGKEGPEIEQLWDYLSDQWRVLRDAVPEERRFSGQVAADSRDYAEQIVHMLQTSREDLFPTDPGDPLQAASVTLPTLYAATQLIRVLDESYTFPLAAYHAYPSAINFITQIDNQTAFKDEIEKRMLALLPSQSTDSFAGDAERILKVFIPHISDIRTWVLQADQRTDDDDGAASPSSLALQDLDPELQFTTLAILGEHLVRRSEIWNLTIERTVRFLLLVHRLPAPGASTPTNSSVQSSRYERIQSAWNLHLDFSRSPKLARLIFASLSQYDEKIKEAFDFWIPEVKKTESEKIHPKVEPEDVESFLNVLPKVIGLYQGVLHAISLLEGEKGKHGVINFWDDNQLTESIEDLPDDRFDSLLKNVSSSLLGRSDQTPEPKFLALSQQFSSQFSSLLLTDNTDAHMAWFQEMVMLVREVYETYDLMVIPFKKSYLQDHKDNAYSNSAAQTVAKKSSELKATEVNLFRHQGLNNRERDATCALIAYLAHKLKDGYSADIFDEWRTENQAQIADIVNGKESGTRASIGFRTFLREQRYCPQYEKWKWQQKMLRRFFRSHMYDSLLEGFPTHFPSHIRYRSRSRPYAAAASFIISVSKISETPTTPSFELVS